MPINETELEFFRLKFRLFLIERLVLRLSFSALQSGSRRSIQAARKELSDYLERAAELADQVYGEHYRDPALAALYADEVREMVQSLVNFVATLPDGD
jgi:hypothetical protein